jgi:hypothetical protein
MAVCLLIAYDFGSIQRAGLIVGLTADAGAFTQARWGILSFIGDQEFV